MHTEQKNGGNNSILKTSHALIKGSRSMQMEKVLEN